MTVAERKMKPLDDEIKRIDAEIERLRAKREGIIRARELLSGGPSESSPPAAPSRKRSANVKPIVLDIMAAAGAVGATSAEVTGIVKEKVPTVAKHTVGSVLSRLKADGALVFDGERYYDARFAPKPTPFEKILRVAG